MPFFITMFLFILFSSVIEAFVPFLSVLDNAIVFAILIMAILKAISEGLNGKKTISTIGIITLVTCIILFLIAIIPNIMNSEHASFLQQLLTFYADIKFVILFFCGIYVFENIDLTSTKELMLRISWLFTIICSLMYLVNLVVPFLQSFDTRFGITTYSFGFGHPAQFALTAIVFSVLRIFFSLKDNERMPYIYLLLNFGLVFVAGRSTSIGFYVCLLILAIVFPYVKRIPISFVAVLGAVFLWLSWGRIMSQFMGDSNEARGLLLRTSIKIARDNFPFGAGLGMFGSNAARVDYSPYFSKYNLDDVWGLTKENPHFATDSYWAMIIGELGFLGVICMLILFGLVISGINMYLKNEKPLTKVIVLLPFIYALLTSPIDTVMVSKSIIIVIFAVLYMCLYIKKANEKREET
ncbi:hypothetical protein X560_2382 [Listeria fleischmannii 1991]|uniref:Lipid A core - O-antigen ligase and related enzymes n=2 Tax=Listeria fleischmannii TaxID=1069827 RepID=A0A2X3H7H3_9LIST|nr:hypothetical protein [Listeria fleischmannii]EMG28737.1 hypothetical protein LFLEISCH_04120 [Listeria fleischmannii subsp. fleischmannii LU2006-1]KMT58245.1 hypothetical protein X560_2382 [Listeria fleischmannii 1991]SQC70486.1 Lipid A core - O-antigen ligase and related enzymes [Listeria fleischmannii subsp. fleischmannii]